MNRRIVIRLDTSLSDRFDEIPAVILLSETKAEIRHASSCVIRFSVST